MKERLSMKLYNFLITVDFVKKKNQGFFTGIELAMQDDVEYLQVNAIDTACFMRILLDLCV